MGQDRTKGTDSLSGLLEKTQLRRGDGGPAPIALDAASQESRAEPIPRAPKLPKFLQRTLYGTLELSTVLDALNIVRHPEHSAVQTVVESLIEQGLTQHTIGLYNAHFGTQTMPLRLALDMVGPRENIPHATPDVSPANVGVAIWKLLTSQDPTRLRRCLECRTYFFDRTRNRQKHYCTPRCASRVTSREHRATGKERARRAARRVTTNRKNPPLS